MHHTIKSSRVSLYHLTAICCSFAEVETALEAGIPSANNTGSWVDQLGVGWEAAPHLHGRRAHHLPSTLGGSGHGSHRGVLHVPLGLPVGIAHIRYALPLYCLDGRRQAVVVISMPEPAPPPRDGCHRRYQGTSLSNPSRYWDNSAAHLVCKPIPTLAYVWKPGLVSLINTTK